MTDNRGSSSPETHPQGRNDGKETVQQGDGKPPNRERSIRWQSNTNQQLGHANNLFLAFAVATMGFEFSLLNDQAAKPPCGLLLVGFVMSLVFLGLSFVLGLLVVVNRLEDFRETAKAARAREDGDEIKWVVHREAARKLGDKTWLYLTAQLWMFGIGLLVGVVTLAALVLRRIN